MTNIQEKKVSSMFVKLPSNMIILFSGRVAKLNFIQKVMFILDLYHRKTIN